METLTILNVNIASLVEIEKKHPDFLYTPLFEYITKWLAMKDDEKIIALPTLYTVLGEGQDCDHMGTSWEKEWLENGKVCRCPACNTARKCISIIKNMDI